MLHGIKTDSQQSQYTAIQHIAVREAMRTFRYDTRIHERSQREVHHHEEGDDSFQSRYPQTPAADIIVAAPAGEGRSSVYRITSKSFIVQREKKSRICGEKVLSRGRRGGGARERDGPLVRSLGSVSCADVQLTGR